MDSPLYRMQSYHEYREHLLAQGASGTAIHRAYIHHCESVRAQHKLERTWS